MAARPNRSPPGAPLETLEEIALFRAREEALEVRARRQLVEEQRRLARRQQTQRQVEIGHQRLALIERGLLVVIAVISAVLSVVLAILGALSPEVVAVAGAVFGGLGVATRRTITKSRP